MRVEKHSSFSLFSPSPGISESVLQKQKKEEEEKRETNYLFF